MQHETTELTEFRGEWFFDNEPDPSQPPRCPKADSPTHDKGQCILCERMRRWVRSTVDRLEAEVDDDEGDGWAPVSLSSAEPPPPATLLELGEGTGDYLIRAGDVVNLHGKKAGGKTPLAYLLVAQEVRKGNLALIVDYEMGPNRARALLSELGLSGPQIDAGVYYVYSPPLLTAAGAARLTAELDRRTKDTGRPLTVVVIDSLTKSMTRVPGADDNSSQSMASWYGAFPHWLRDETGAAVVVIDHSSNTDGPRPSGSHKKGEEVDFHIWLRHDYSFSRKRPEKGQSSLVVVKDRSGEREIDGVAAYLRTTGKGGTFTVEPVPEGESGATGDGEVDIDLTAVGGPASDEENVLRDLRAAGTAGIAKTPLCTDGQVGKIRREALKRLVKDGKAVIRKVGRVQKCWAVEHAPPEAIEAPDSPRAIEQ